MVALSSVESELCAALKTASEGLGIQSVARVPGEYILQTESALGCLGNDVPGQSQGLGKAKHVDMQNSGYRRLPSQAGSPRRRLTRV